MPDEPTPADLEEAFRRVQREQMRDVPILNPVLAVAAVGFRDWEGYRLGVMLTPWFMNLMLLPGARPPWPGLRIGDARSYRFPSGTYEFLLGEHDGIGRYLSCSLFSPVFEFEDQEAALATAQAVMQELFNVQDLPEAGRGTPPGPPGATGDAADQPQPGPDAGRDEPPEPASLSRRGFLRGDFIGGRG